MRAFWTAFLCCSAWLAAASLFIAPARAADPAPDTAGAAPCGKLVGQSDAAGGTDGGFDLRDGEAVDFVSASQTTHGRLLVFHDGPVFRAYWQPQGSEEKYALANAGPRSVRLISTPPQGTPARDGKPGVMTQPLFVLSCPKL